MILFDLICKNGHKFEGWFPSTIDYEKQNKKKLISCPICECNSIQKALMAPNISVSSKTKKNEKKLLHQDISINKKVKELKKYIEKNTENVGKGFAEEARKIHYGEKKPRPIRGETTDKEAKDLKEEGIPFSRLPWLREDA